MNTSISIICYKYKTLKNGECALMLRITKDRKTKYQSLGISILPQFWDFEKNQPKRNCPNKEAILRLITEKTKEYQEQLLELKIENKDFTAKSLIEKVDKPVKHKTVDELFQERIQELKAANRLGYAESHEYVYKSLQTKQLIKLPIASKAMEVILKYKSDKSPYLFPILTDKQQTESEQRDKIRQAMKSVNKHLKDIGEELNLPIDLTTYVARHSFATVLKRSGVNTSIICEAMGHSSEKVTQIYLDSFENEQVDAAMSNLL